MPSGEPGTNGRKYKFKTKPYAHQVRALKKLLSAPAKHVGGGLLMEMGTGKTKTVIDFACIQKMEGNVDRVLVVAPLSVLTVWDGEIRKHCPDKKLLWKAVNYDKLPRQHHFELIANWVRDGKTLVVFDESHKIKNPNAKTSRAANVLGRLSVRTVSMTGTPIEKHPLDLFMQMKVIDEAILGSSWGTFKRQYAVWGGYGGYQLIKYLNLDSLKRRVDPYTFRITKDECLDLPAKSHQVIPVDLEPKSRDIYNEMATQMVAEFEELEVEAPIVLTKLLRLSQITGGWLSDQDQRRQIGTEKQEKTQELLQDMWEEDISKVVVFCRFLNDLRSAAHAAKTVGYRVLPLYGKISKDQRERFIAKFDETDKPTVFVTQIATGSLGISLTAASRAIFYSHSYSSIDFEQAQSRLHRIGQRNPVTYYHLLARDTVDEAVWLALRTKRRVAELVLKQPELLM